LASSHETQIHIVSGDHKEIYIYPLKLPNNKLFELLPPSNSR